jgi:hypothetical protein
MENEDQPLEGREGVSRRKMLKRIGAGAAVAWTAPILTSIRTPAFAASPGVCDPASCAGDPCGNQTPCPTNPGACTCSQDVGGGCVCIAIFGCPGAPCATDADCGPGNVCTNTCCGNNQCAALCTGSAKRATGAKLSYRR